MTHPWRGYGHGVGPFEIHSERMERAEAEPWWDRDFLIRAEDFAEPETMVLRAPVPVESHAAPRAHGDPAMADEQVHG